MTRRLQFRVAMFGALALALALGARTLAQQEPDDRFRFRSGVELINVTATVTDKAGRFVPGLTKDDFTIYEDDRPQQITHFSADRVPVSLGLVVDTSGSMAGERMIRARRALVRFIQQLSPDDEVFISRFSDHVELLQDWSSDGDELMSGIRRLRAQGGTALYDGVADAVERAQQGRNRKKAVVVISDGEDTTSLMRVDELKTLIQQSEVLVYAIGIEGDSRSGFTMGWQQRQWPPGRPGFPVPGGQPGFPPRQPPTIPPRGPVIRGGGDSPLNVRALQEFAEQTGGRTEVVRHFDDLDPAVASIAEELSRQYLLAYVPPRTETDGRWHSIRVEVQDSRHTVRARTGYLSGS